MAAWQVDFAVVPRRALASRDVAASSNVIAAEWWRSNAPPSDYQRQLAAIAPPAASSSTNLQTWGVEDGNRIEVRSVDGRVSAIIVRVDVRRPDSRFGATLLQFVRLADAVLIRSDGLIVEPLVGAFAAALRSSNAWRFASDPAKDIAAYSDLDESDE